MKTWNCNECGRELESELEPENCPCGNDSIEPKEQLSMLEQMMKDYLNKNSKKAES